MNNNNSNKKQMLMCKLYLKKNLAKKTNKHHHKNCNFMEIKSTVYRTNGKKTTNTKQKFFNKNKNFKKTLVNLNVHLMKIQI